MAGSHDFPALFTIEGTGRPEIILVNPGLELSELKEVMDKLMASSPNCAETLGKYRSKDIKDTAKEIRVRWAAEGRDQKLFPKDTLLTEDNCEAVLRMMAVGVGKDCFDVVLLAKK